jgi:hypothetical protein
MVDIQGASLTANDDRRYKPILIQIRYPYNVSISIKPVNDSSISYFHKVTINQHQIKFINHTVDISQK